jgi:polysaccharide deacetylase family protein (PEP-CTERM system associated)
MTNVLSVDVEEYFHPPEVRASITASDWNKLPSRIERQIMQILDLFERHKAYGTFFVLGWIAEKHPRLIRTIAAAGHEIGSHGYSHQLVYNLTPDEFRRDTERCVDAIGTACGITVRSYRAPSYSITKRSLWALDILADLGFSHDSSIYPIARDRYDISDFERHAHTIQTSAGAICEVPIATVKLRNGHMAPVGGGAYLRLLPYQYTAAGLHAINHTEDQPACVYFHAWEIDPDQPQLASSLIARLRTCTGLRAMMQRLDRLLTDFCFSSMNTVHSMALSDKAAMIIA